MIIIQTTIDEDKKARELINLLLETNKIACGTFHKIQSSYKWKKQIVEEPELEISLYTKRFFSESGAKIGWTCISMG